MGRGRNMGKNEKLSRKEKQELRKDGDKMREQLRTIVVPSICVVVGIIIVYVFLKTRSFPNIADADSKDF